MCRLQLSMKKHTGAQDVFDGKVMDDLLSNFNEKYALLHSILQCSCIVTITKSAK